MRQVEFALDPRGVYVVIRPFKSDGLELQRDDRLPASSALRKNPRKLKTLCSHRYLQPVMSQEMEPVMQQETSDDASKRGRKR